MSNQFGFGDILQKAFYFGVGLADYAQEQASEKLKELRTQSQKLADELVKRGEMNSEEARQFVEQLISEAQRGQANSSSETPEKGEPRRIEIIEEDEEPTNQTEQSSGETGSEDIDTLRQQVESLREELKRLHKK
jgi:polyhydroxyalkanoate synthesis regulator phasin